MHKDSAHSTVIGMGKFFGIDPFSFISLEHEMPSFKLKGKFSFLINMICLQSVNILNCWNSLHSHVERKGKRRKSYCISYHGFGTIAC